MSMTAATSWARGNWFILLLPLLLLVEFAFSRADVCSGSPGAEAAMLFDLCLFVPALYVLCYRGKLSPKALALRAVALFCLGVFIASKLVPPDAQIILPQLSWARTVGLALLALIELRLLFEVLKMVFSGRSTTKEVAARTGGPEWVVRLMLLEARFWKAVWKLIRGR